MQVEGPLVEQWPPAGHELLYGDLGRNEVTEKNALNRLNAFAEAAYRRPLEVSELAPIEALVSAKIDEGLTPLEALQLGFQAILCSPGFLYLSEGEGLLNDYALASRLSYFLWSSMPDEELLALASSGSLKDSRELRPSGEDVGGSEVGSICIEFYTTLARSGQYRRNARFRRLSAPTFETALRKL